MNGSVDQPKTILIGAGVVGTAILQSHVDRGTAVRFCDIDANALNSAAGRVQRSKIATTQDVVDGLVTRVVTPEPSGRHVDSVEPKNEPSLVIESVAERLDVKRSLLTKLAETLDPATVYCSNTSTLLVSAIADSLSCEAQVMGMHFFMPVDQRPGVELVRGNQTSQAAFAAASHHASRLGKTPIVVGDGPGFVVNRMLAPYLGKAMELVTSGATADQIERAALRFGMPLSPLELIDVIGIKTTIEAGRGYWAAFPERMNPSPIVAGLYKRGRLGRDFGGGFYDYVDGMRSPGLSPEATVLCEDYTREKLVWTDEAVEHQLAVTMWIEAQCLLRDKIADSFETVDLAMQHGLGYTTKIAWSKYYKALSQKMLTRLLSDPKMRTPAWLREKM